MSVPKAHRRVDTRIGLVGYWNAFKRLASGASGADKAALFPDTARDFCRLS